MENSSINVSVISNKIQKRLASYVKNENKYNIKTSMKIVSHFIKIFGDKWVFNQLLKGLPQDNSYCINKKSLTQLDNQLIKMNLTIQNRNDIELKEPINNFTTHKNECQSRKLKCNDIKDIGDNVLIKICNYLDYNSLQSHSKTL